MQNRETGKTYKKSPMGGTPKPTTTDTVYKKSANYIPTEKEERQREAINKLVTAYNSKAYANSKAPLLEQYEMTTDVYPYAHEDSVNLMSRGSEDLSGRLAFANRWKTQNGTSYNVGHDLGNLYRGMGEVGVTTPAGRFSRGFEDNTDYLSYENKPGLNDIGFDAYYNSGYMDYPLDVSAHYGRDDDGANSLYAFAKAPVNQNYYNQVDTPLGFLAYGSNAQDNINKGSVYASFTPNDYIQALANLLYR